MKTLVIYDTYTGTTEKCAKLLGERLQGEIHVLRVPRNGNVEVERYDTVVIGSYVHAGKVSRRIARFCKTNLQALLQKRVGIFLCMLDKPENLGRYLNNNFNVSLIEHAFAKACFGSELNFEKMNPIVRFLIKLIIKKAQPEVGLRPKEIDKFVSTMNS